VQRRHDERLAFPLIEGAVCRQYMQREVHTAPSLSRFALAYTSSSVPTLKNAASGSSSVSPETIALKPRSVSRMGTYAPGTPVNFSATNMGWDKNRCTFLAR